MPPDPECRRLSVESTRTISLLCLPRIPEPASRATVSRHQLMLYTTFRVPRLLHAHVFRGVSAHFESRDATLRSPSHRVFSQTTVNRFSTNRFCFTSQGLAYAIDGSQSVGYTRLRKQQRQPETGRDPYQSHQENRERGLLWTFVPSG